MRRWILLAASLATFACGSATVEDKNASGSAETARVGDVRGADDPSAVLAAQVLSESSIGEMSIADSRTSRRSWGYTFTEHGVVVSVVDGENVLERIALVVADVEGVKKAVGVAWTNAENGSRDIQDFIVQAKTSYDAALANVGEVPEITFTETTHTACEMKAVMANLGEALGGVLVMAGAPFLCLGVVTCAGAGFTLAAGVVLIGDSLTSGNDRVAACADIKF